MEDIIKYGRRVGNSTRQADLCIQELFTKGYTICRDHASNTDNKMNKFLFYKVLNRIELEHAEFIRKPFYDIPKFIIALDDKFLNEALLEIRNEKYAIRNTFQNSKF